MLDERILTIRYASQAMHPSALGFGYSSVSHKELPRTEPDRGAVQFNLGKRPQKGEKWKWYPGSVVELKKWGSKWHLFCPGCSIRRHVLVHNWADRKWYCTYCLKLPDIRTQELILHSGDSLRYLKAFDAYHEDVRARVCVERAKRQTPEEFFAENPALLEAFPGIDRMKSIDPEFYARARVYLHKVFKYAARRWLRKKSRMNPIRRRWFEAQLEKRIRLELDYRPEERQWINVPDVLPLSPLENSSSPQSETESSSKKTNSGRVMSAAVVEGLERSRARRVAGLEKARWCKAHAVQAVSTPAR